MFISVYVHCFSCCICSIFLIFHCFFNLFPQGLSIFFLNFNVSHIVVFVKVHFLFCLNVIICLFGHDVFFSMDNCFGWIFDGFQMILVIKILQQSFTIGLVVLPTFDPYVLKHPNHILDS